MILGNVIQEDTREKALEKKDAEIEIKKITISIAHDIIMILGIKNIGFRKGRVSRRAVKCFNACLIFFGLLYLF